MHTHVHTKVSASSGSCVVSDLVDVLGFNSYRRAMTRKSPVMVLGRK